MGIWWFQVYDFSACLYIFGKCANMTFLWLGLFIYLVDGSLFSVLVMKEQLAHLYIDGFAYLIAKQ